MDIKKLIILIFVFIILGYAGKNKITHSKIVNTYNILAGDTLSSENIPSDRKKLLPDSGVPRGLSGVFNVMIISEHVDEKDPLYNIISQLNIEPTIKKKLLNNLTDGILKIYFDLGATRGNFENNYRIFEEELHKTGSAVLTTPPDFIVLSHAHWPNYMGGIAYFQERYPDIPIFITADMEGGLVCWLDFLRKNSIKTTPKNGRIIKIKNPIVLLSGTTVLTERLSIITQEFRRKCPELILENGKIVKGILDVPKFENILAVNTKEGIALFTTCMHSSFSEAIRKAMKLYNKEVYLYCGGFEDKLEAIIEAKRASPSLSFYLYHCAPVEELISKLGMVFIKRIKLGERLSLNLY